MMIIVLKNRYQIDLYFLETTLGLTIVSQLLMSYHGFMSNLLIAIYARSPQLSHIRMLRLSEICSDIGVVVFASVALPAVLDKYDPLLIVWGLALSIIFWMVSVWLSEKGE